jgi:hypothetical protein
LNKSKEDFCASGVSGLIKSTAGATAGGGVFKNDDSVCTL